MIWVRFMRRVLVEWIDLKPCCVGERGLRWLMLVRISPSIKFDELLMKIGNRRLVHWLVCWV